MITLVMFDLGNVVILADHARTWEALGQYGISAETARRFYSGREYADFARGGITEEQFRQAINHRLGTSLSLDVMRHVHDQHIIGIDAEVVALVRQVSVPIAIATDTNVWQSACERRLIDVSQFNPLKVFRSNEIGRLKRDDGTFEYFVHELGRPPEQILLVDDNITICRRARRVGIIAHPFVDAASLRHVLGYHHVI